MQNSRLVQYVAKFYIETSPDCQGKNGVHENSSRMFKTAVTRRRSGKGSQFLLGATYPNGKESLSHRRHLYQDRMQIARHIVPTTCIKFSEMLLLANYSWGILPPSPTPGVVPLFSNFASFPVNVPRFRCKAPKDRARACKSPGIRPLAYGKEVAKVLIYFGFTRLCAIISTREESINCGNKGI